MKRAVSDELYAAIAAAQTAAQRAHNLAYAENQGVVLCMALGRAQSILMSWQVRLARRR